MKGISPQLVMHDYVVALSLQRQSMGFILSLGRAHILGEKKGGKRRGETRAYEESMTQRAAVPYS